MVPALDARSGSRPASRGGLHQQSLLRGKSQRFRKRFVDRNRLHSKKRLVHFAIGNQIVCDAFRGIDRNGEANSRRCTARRIDRRIDADHFAMSVDQRPAGISAVDRCVGLNRFIDQGVLPGLHRAAQRAHHSRRQRALKSKRIADRQNFLPHLKSGGITQRQHGERFVSRLNLNQRHIVSLIRTDKLRGVPRLIAQHHFNRLRAFHHVKICQDVALGIDNKSRARAFHRYRVHPEIVLGRLRQHVRHRRRRLPVDPYVQCFVAA